MKYIVWFVSILVLFLGGLYGLLFSNVGNQIVKPYLQKEIQKNVQNKVEINSFSLRTNFIDMEITLDDKSKIIINGDLSLFDLGFNLNYMLALKDIKTNYGNVDGIVALKGNVVGKMEDFDIKGSGEVFDAKTDVEIGVKNKQPTLIKVYLNGLHVEKVLALLNQPIYSKGFVDVSATLEPNSAQELNGKGDVQIHFAQLDSDVIEKQFHVKIPANTTYRGDINFILEDGNVVAKTNLISNLFTLKTSKTLFELDSQKLYSDFILSIPNFSSLKELIGVDLYGNAKVVGDITKTKDLLDIHAKSDILGGNILANMHNDNAAVKISNIYVSELLKMLKQSPYSSGLLNADVNVTSIKNLNFTSLAHISDATVDAQVLKKVLGKESAPDIPYNIDINSTGHNQVIQTNSTFKSKLANIFINDATYDVSKKRFYGKYALHVDSLRSFDFLLGKKLDVKLDTHGEYKMVDANLSLAGESDFLDAKTNYTLQNSLLHLNTNELAIEKVTNMLHYPTVFKAYTSAVMDYDLQQSKGKFSIQTLNGKLTQSQLTLLVGALLKFDISKEIYTKGLINGIIDKQNVDYSALLTGLNSNFALKEGKINTKDNSIFGKFSVKVKTKDVNGTISGSLDNPKVKINNSAYLKEKIEKQIDKHIPEKWQEPVKNLLNLF